VIEVKSSVELPEGLAALPPGPALAAALASIDRGRLSGFDLVIVLAARARQLAYEQAELAADLVAVADRVEVESSGLSWMWNSDIDPCAAAEIAAALTWTKRTALARLQEARLFMQRLPAVWEAMRAGRIDEPKARVLVHGTQVLDEPTAREVVGRILPQAPELTTGQLAHRLRRLVIEADADAAAKAYEQGVAERKVVRGLNPDGTAYLSGCNLPADTAAAADERLDAYARAAKRHGDTRSIDVIRADIYLALLAGTYTGPAPIHRRGVIELTADLATLMGLADRAGELAGWGPVIADITRQIAEQHTGDSDTIWRYSITHPLTGALLHHGTMRSPRPRDPRRFPTATQRAFVIARDRTCTGPGCRVPANRAEIDHRIDWAKGGPTRTGNLDAKCAGCHDLKDAGWTITHNHFGDATWTSLLGHTYRVPARPVTPPPSLSVLEQHLLDHIRMQM
jgi:hypothetical protein